MIPGGIRHGGRKIAQQAVSDGGVESAREGKVVHTAQGLREESLELGNGPGLGGRGKGKSQGKLLDSLPEQPCRRPGHSRSGVNGRGASSCGREEGV